MTLLTLFHLKKNSDNKIIEDAIKTIVAIAKNHFSDVMNNLNIKYGYKDVLLSNNEYSYKQKKSIFILFKEMLKEGVIKKEESGSEIIEEISIIGEEMKRIRDIFFITEDLLNTIDDFNSLVKEKGFKEKSLEDKNKIITDYVYRGLKEICKEVCFTFVNILVK